MLLKQEVFKNLEAMWRDEDSGEDHTVSSYLMIGLVGCYSPGSGCMFQFQTAGLDVRPQLNFEFPTPGLPVRGQRRIDVLQAQVDANSWSLWHLVVSTYMYIVISYIYIYKWWPPKPWRISSDSTSCQGNLKKISTTSVCLLKKWRHFLPWLLVHQQTGIITQFGAALFGIFTWQVRDLQSQLGIFTWIG